jgi:hypothetical protein
MMESGIVPLYGDTSKKGLLPPGYRPYVTMGGASEISGGGIPSSTLGKFNFLRSYLYEDKNETKGYLTRYRGEGYSKGEIYFLPNIKEVDKYGRPIPSTEVISETKRQKGIFFIGYTGGKKYATLDAYSNLEEIGGNIKFYFGKFQYYKKDSINPETIELSSDVLPIKSLTIEREAPLVARGAYTYSIKGTEKPINDVFNGALARVVVFLKKATDGDTSYSTSSSGIIISETGTAEELRLARIVQNLTKTKPLGHCLARALQLLQTLPLKGEGAVSHICKAKFFEQTTNSAAGVKTTSSRSGIPEPGSSLDSSPGLAALSQLFYDTVLIGSPKIIIGTTPKPGQPKSSIEQYMDFMKIMGRLFGDDTFSKTPISDDTIKSGLKSIRNKRDSDFCKGIDGNLSVPPNMVRNVYDVVNQLYQTQVKHAAECGKIVRLLFDIERDKSSGRYRISLSDNIIKKGFPEIERVNYLARQVLVNYYSKCEMTYLQGMKIVLDTSPEAIEARRRRAPATAAATPSAPAPAI